jgi:predicted transcriptional regulator
VTVRDALVADPRVLAADAPAREVAELLSRPQVETALVVDGDRLVGCVTRASIVAAVAGGDDVQRLTARDLMEDAVTTVSPDASLDEALHLMAERGLERLAVTEDGRLLGVVAREPLVRRIMEDEPPPADEEPVGAI